GQRARWRRADDFGAAVAVLLAVITDQCELQRAAYVSGDQAAHTPALIAIDCPVECDVADGTVETSVVSGEPSCNSLAHRHVDSAPQLVFLVGGRSSFDMAAKLVTRPPGHDVDHACRCVLAEQRALRAAQNFDALNVIKVAKRFAG